MRVYIISTLILQELHYTDIELIKSEYKDQMKKT